MSIMWRTPRTYT